MIDFKNITSETSLYNFHSHTQFCDGRASMEEMAYAAIKCDMLHYGFSPHGPIKCESPCNMSFDSVGKYFDEFHRLQEMFSDKINLYASMEIDYLNKDFGPHIDYFQRLNLDYRIGSVHFVKNQDGIPIDCDGRFERFKQRLNDAFRDDIRYVVEKFYEQVLTMIEMGGFDIIAHFDKIGHNASLAKPGIEDEHWYQSLVNDVIDFCKWKNIIVEVNTKALTEHKRLFPSTRWLRKVITSELPLVINSDAHYSDKINTGRDEAIKIINDLKHSLNA